MKIELSQADLAANPNRFDWALKTFRTPGDIIVVRSGAKALTLGSWAFPESAWIGLAGGVQLVVERDAEVILSPAAIRSTGVLERPDRDLNLLWIGDGSSITGGGRLNANYKDHPGWSCGGVRAHGDFLLDNVQIVGLSGDRNGQESFAVSSIGKTGGSLVRKVVVQDCKVDGPQDYVSGIYVGATEDNGVESLVEDCVVRLGEFGQFAYSSSYQTRFRRCHGEAMRWWYTDTGPGVAIIEKAEGAASYSAIGSVATSRVPRSVTIADSKIRQLGQASRVVEWWNKGGENVGAITSFRCKFLGFKWRTAVAAKTGAITFIDSETITTEGDAMEADSIKPSSVVLAS